MEESLSQHVEIAVRLFGEGDAALVQIFQQLGNDCKDILEIAPSYDLNENLQFNGLRSFVKIICLYMSRIVSLASKSRTRRRKRLLEEYTDLAPLLVKQMQM